MNIVLLSGGSGKRLWPLSNDARSKQFLKVLENSAGEKVSMLERIWSQLTSVGLAESTVIATSKGQVDMINNQLGSSVPLIIEPKRRDTFPAIALAAAYLYTVKKVNINEVVAVLPVDSYVNDYFFEKIKELKRVLNESQTKLALIGVKPTYPSVKYGYIIPQPIDKQKDYLKVLGFREKPSEQEAETLIQKNALWNCGVFAFKLEYILSILDQKGLTKNYYQLIKNYDQLPNISFDYEVVEKTIGMTVLPYKGSWKDL